MFDTRATHRRWRKGPGTNMSDEGFHEFPDFVPDDLFDENNVGLFEQSFLADDSSVADFLSLVGYSSSMSPEERDKLRENLNALALSASMSAEKIEKTEIPSDLLFIGSDGRRVVKGLHYSRDALGEDGPVILPISSPTVIVGAFSDEFVQKDAEEISSQYDSYEEQSEAWERRMGLYALRIAQRYDDDPPSGVDEFLKNID